MSDKSGTFTGVRYLQETGLCYSRSGKKNRCALHREDCISEDKEVYKSYFEALQINDEGCDPNDVYIGRCLDQVEGTECAVRNTDCVDTSAYKFSEPDDACTLQRDKSKEWDVNNPEFTQFGSCMFEINGADEYFCVYSPLDCESINDYMTPAQTRDVGKICNCYNVHVTACVAGGDLVYCGIDKNSCGTTDVAVSPMEQRSLRLDDPENLDCRLCEQVNTATPTRSPTRTPVQAPPTPPPVPLTFAPTVPPTVPSIAVRTVNNKGGENGVIVGGIIGGVLALLVTLILVYRYLYQERSKQNGVEKFTPPLDITIT